jgi:hypothetical protein
MYIYNFINIIMHTVMSLLRTRCYKTTSADNKSSSINSVHSLLLFYTQIMGDYDTLVGEYISEVNIYVHMYVHTYHYINIYGHMCICIFIYICIYICIHIHTYIHTYIYTYDLYIGELQSSDSCPGRRSFYYYE